MDNKKFVEEVYNPYQEAWGLIKPLQHLKPDSSDSEWRKWNEQTLEFRKKYENSEFGCALFRLLTDAGCAIGKMNE